MHLEQKRIKAHKQRVFTVRDSQIHFAWPAPGHIQPEKLLKVS